MKQTEAMERGGSLVPSAALMHCAFVLTGLGTAMLGPLLPLLTKQWGLRDEQSGLLLMAQFCGAFLGGVSVSWRLRRSLLLGMGAAAAGVACFAMAPGLPVACVGLLLAGFGLGHSITAVNIVAGQRFKARRASALALLNFVWSFGAMLAPLLTAWLAPRFAVRTLLLCFALLFAVCGAAMALEMRGASAETRVLESDVMGGTGLQSKVLLLFMAMLFLYGGLETCLSGWLTTYALRYGDRSLALGEYTTLLLWMSLTAGRAGSSVLLLRAPERIVRRLALAMTVVLTLVLGFAHTATTIALATIFLGLSLAPWFPVTFSLLMGERPRARQAGIVIAVSGLGAAALPWMMGVVSTRAGSLQVALVIPLVAAAGLLGMSFAGRPRGV
ncbi:MAG: MFS transporter [Acidobacteriaceae bacterium]